MMNKFDGPEDENFKSVSGSIKIMVQAAKRITLAQREGETSVWPVVDQHRCSLFSDVYVRLSCKHS